MSGLLTFLLFGALFFFMMRSGCGSHAGHGGHGGHGGADGPGNGPEGPVPHALAESEDPVCGMKVAGDMGYAKMYRGNSYRFCSRDCLDKFEADPDRYAATPSRPAALPGPGSGPGRRAP